MNHMFEVGRRVSGVDGRPNWDFPDPRLVKQWQKGSMGIEGKLHGSVEFEEHMARIMDPVGPKLADRALGYISATMASGHRMISPSWKPPDQKGSWHTGNDVP